MIAVEIENRDTKILLNVLQKKISNLNPFFVNIQAYMQSVTIQTFKRLKSGGRYRGVEWLWFAPQYTRMDGAVISAEGGMAKIQGKGKVKGRLRHSGKRISKSSNIMRDTGRLQSSALDWIHKRKNVMIMDTKLDYAKYQNKLRPFAFFEIPKDERVIQGLFLKHIESL